MHEAILVEGTINFSNTLTMMNLLSLLLTLLLTVPVYSQTGPNTLSDSSDIVKTKDGYVLGKKSDIGKIILKDKSKLTVLGFDVDTTSCNDCLVTKFESLDKDAFFKKDTISFIVKSCIFSNMKINKGIFVKEMLKGLSKLEGSGFIIDTNIYVECFLTKFKSSDKDVFFNEDPENFVKACLSSSLKINRSDIAKILLKKLRNFKNSGIDIDTNNCIECLVTKYESLGKDALFNKDTSSIIVKSCIFSSMTINRSNVAKILLKKLRNSNNLGFEIDTNNCIDCLVSKYESLDKDALFNKDTVSFIINACVFSSMRINKDSVLRIALLEFCKDSLTKIGSDLKKLSIEGGESLETYCDCFATNLLKIEESKRKDVINEWESLSGEYNNSVVFPCMQLAQSKRRQNNAIYNPDDILGSVDSSNVELLKIGEHKMVLIRIGDISKYYLVDTGSDLLLIDKKSEQELINSKKLLPSMFIDEKQLTLADNRKVNAKVYNIDKVSIGSYTVKNVEIGVIENGALLCGMSLLQKFRHWKIDSEINVLKLFK